LVIFGITDLWWDYKVFLLTAVNVDQIVFHSHVNRHDLLGDWMDHVADRVCLDAPTQSARVFLLHHQLVGGAEILVGYFDVALVDGIHECVAAIVLAIYVHRWVDVEYALFDSFVQVQINLSSTKEQI